MSGRSLADIERLLGRDLFVDYAQAGGLFEDADLRSRRASGRAGRDLVASDGLRTFTQAVANRLKTRRGELASLGHAGYGSRHHELLGEPNVPRTRNLIKLYVLQALRDEPRIEKVLRAEVRPEHDPPRESVRIELEVRVIGVATPVNLIVPFFLETAP